MLGDSRRPQAAVFRYQASGLIRRPVYPCQMFRDSLARESRNPRHGYRTSDFSGLPQAAVLPQPRAAPCLRARVRARAQTRTVTLFTKRPRFVTRSSDRLAVDQNYSLLIFVLTTRFLIFAAVTNERSPLRGDRSFARLRRIVA